MSQNTIFKFLWITDPWETLDHPNDTTLRLIQESVSLGFINYWCDAESIKLTNGRVTCNGFLILEVKESRDSNSFKLADACEMELTVVDSIQFRIDPPVNSKFLQVYQLVFFSLESLLKDNSNIKIQIVNNPTSILMSDKIEGLFVGNTHPNTIVSSNCNELIDFAKKNIKIILKPLNYCQGLEVNFIDLSDINSEQNLYGVLKNATENFTRLIVAQEFLHQIQEGETRLWYLDGKLIGFAKKILCSDSYIINTDKGDKIVATELTKHQIELSKKIGVSLMLRGIRLAAIDIINDNITDYNFISPGLLVQIEKVMQKNLANLIINRFVSQPVFYDSIWKSQMLKNDI